MHLDEQDVLFVVEPQHLRPDQRSARQVEGATGRRHRAAPDLELALGGRQLAEVHDDQRHRRRRRHELARLTRHGREERAQGRVTPHDLGEAAGQCLDVRSSPQAHGPRDVVRPAARLELIEEPQPLLGERQRQGAGSRQRAQRRRGDGTRAAPGRVDMRRELGHGRRLEHPSHGQIDRERLAQARDHPRGQQRVTAELEEVLVDAHALDAKHLGPDVGDDLLDRRARPVLRRAGAPAARHPGARVDPPCRSASVEAPAARRGSPAACSLATTARGTGGDRRARARPPASPRRRRGAARHVGPRAPPPPPRARPGAVPAPPRSRPARCGSRGSSPGGRAGRGTPACRPRASARGRPYGRAGPPGAPRTGRPRTPPRSAPDLPGSRARRRSPPTHSSPGTPMGIGVSARSRT